MRSCLCAFTPSLYAAILALILLSVLLVFPRSLALSMVTVAATAVLFAIAAFLYIRPTATLLLVWFHCRFDSCRLEA